MMGANGKRIYSCGTKLAAVRDAVDRGMGLTRVMAECGIAGRCHRQAVGAASGTAGACQGLEAQGTTGVRGRSGAAQPSRVFAGEGRPPGKTPGPAGAGNVTDRRNSRITTMLAGRYRPAGLSKAAGPARSTCLHERSHPDRIARTGSWTSGRYCPASHGERPRAPADPHGPYPRVRHADIRQERARGHAPHGIVMPDTSQEPVETPRLVRRRRRARA